MYTHQHTMTYKDALVRFAELTKDTTVKPFSWYIIGEAKYTNHIKIFENALDYEIGLKFLSVVKLYKGSGKHPKTVTFSFHRGGVDILSASGRKIA